MAAKIVYVEFYLALEHLEIDLEMPYRGGGAYSHGRSGARRINQHKWLVVENLSCPVAPSTKSRKRSTKSRVCLQYMQTHFGHAQCSTRCIMTMNIIKNANFRSVLRMPFFFPCPALQTIASDK